MKSPNASVAAAVALAAAAIPALAHTGPRIWIGSSGTEIVTFKSNNDLAPTSYTASRVFVGGMDEDTLQANGRLDEYPVPGSDFYASEFPGYQVRLSGAGFTPTKTFGFELAGPLLVFDSSEQIFKSVRKKYGSPGPAPQMKLAAGANSAVTGLSPVNGFNFLSYSTAGDHGHLLTSLLGNGAVEMDGPHAVYAVPMRLTATTGLTISKPYYVLFGRDIGYLADGPNQQVFLDAVQIAQNTLANEPDWPGQWWNNASGNWSDANKWMPDVPDVPNLPAQFLSRITAPQTVTVDNNFTTGSLVFNNTNRYTLAGAGTLTLQMSTGATAINVLGGSHTINAPIALASDAQINIASADSILTMTGNFTAAGKAISKTGAGTIEIKHIRAASLDITSGSVAMLQNGSADGVSNVATLTIGSAGRLDLTNNKLITASPAGTQAAGVYDGVQGLVQSGRNGGAWNGTTGIITSQSAAQGTLTTVGVSTGAIARFLDPTETTTWASQTINGDSVMVMYTYTGDANLDGIIDGTDYFYIDSNVGTSVDGYGNGDFNYDGIIDGTDYFYIDSNIADQGAPFFANSGSELLTGAATVPEPRIFSLFSLVGMFFRRSRRNVVV